MKRLLKIIILIVLLFTSHNVYAKEDVYIKSVDVVENSITGDVELLGESTFNDMNLKLNVRFYDLNSSIKYKVVIQNDSNKDYSMADNILDNNEDIFIKYDYSYDDGKIIKGNSTKTFYITVKYSNLVPNNIINNGTYTVNREINVNLLSDFVNPETSRNIIMIFTALLIIVLGIYGFKTNKKIIILPIIVLILIPFSIRGANTITIKMNNEIEIYINLLRTFYGYEDGSEELTYIADAFHLPDYESKITKVEFVKNINVPEDAIVSWDLSDKKDNSIIGYLVNDPENAGMYNLYVGSDHKMYGHPISSSWFYNLTATKQIIFNDLYDTSRAEKLQNLFGDCSLLEQVDVSKFDTSNVTTMAYMFYKCSSLSNIDVSHFDTSKVITMRSMFYNCSNLESIDTSHFNTSNVENMAYMFAGCNNVSSLNVSSFTTSKVTTMRSMFYCCYALTSIDVSSFDTALVKDFGYMFAGYPNGMHLTQIQGLNHFNTSSGESMKSMFMNCSWLESLDLISFNTSNVTDMSGMFHNCGTLRELDLSSFDTSKVQLMNHMFNVSSDDPAGRRIGYLKTLKISNFDFSKVTDIIWFADTLPYVSIEINLNLPTDYNYSRFKGVFGYSATEEDTSIVLNYISSNEEYVDYIIENKSAPSHIIKGRCLDCESGG